MESLLAFLGGFIGVFALVIACQAARPAPLRSQRTSPRRARCCKEAPSRIVDIIDSQSTNGEHLAHAQSVEGTHAETFLGGNIAYKMMCRGLTSSITSLKKFAMSPKSVLNASKTQSSGHDFAANINRPQLNPAP